MVVRVIAVALACLMTGAPVATTACEAACTAREHAAANTVEHHSCHATAAAAGPAMTTSAHDCGHSDDNPNALDQSLQTVHAPGDLHVPLSVTPPVVALSPVRAADVDRSPPGILILTAQLRV